MTDTTIQETATRVLELCKSTVLKTMGEVWSAAPKLAREVLRIPELERDEALRKVAELETAQLPLSMSEALDDGTWVLVEAACPDASQPFDVISCIQGVDGRAWVDESGNPYITESQWSGWRHLPDKSGKGKSNA